MKGIMKIHHLTASIAAVLLSASLFSCSSDDFFGKAETNTDGISFGVSTENGASTRANNSADGYTAARYTLRSDNSADTLCVRAVVTDGIGNSANKPATRAAMHNSMYNDFKVVAEIRENGNIGGQYFMNETATKSGNNWVPAHTYYWPGSNRQLRFLAWAPKDATFDAVPNTPNATTLKYTTPAEAKNQRDLVAAATDFMESPANDGTCTPVDLQFKHLCTAVIIKTGATMTEGIIKSVSITNVKNSGTYDMVNSEWTLNNNSTTDFTISPNKKTTSATTDDTKLNAEDATFMLLPQTLGSDSKLEVIFHDSISGNDRKLSASLKGAEWPMGQTVTYRLSITPEYELKFTSEPKEQDAHYVIYPINIKVDNNLRGGWQLTSNDPANVTFVQTFQADAIKNLVDKGYWFKDHCGTSTLTSSEKGEVKVYVFIKENISNSDRDITLSLTPVDYPSAKPETFTFKQYCPAWNNGIGVERKQEIDYPWGFNWDSNMKITYTMPKSILNALRHILFLIFGDKSYVEDQGSVLFDKEWKVIVDFSKVPPLKTATSTTNGLTNTWEICNFEGISKAQGIMNQLESWGGTPDKTLPTNPSEFAAMACAKKNAYSLKIEKSTDIFGNVEYSYIPTLAKEDMVWYLPARDEAPNMKDDLFNLSGNYWTSTAITDPGTTSYKYTAGGAVSPEDRNSVIHVRAVRKKKAERL